MIATPPAPYGTIISPDGQTIACPRWAPSPDVLAERQRHLSTLYFLVRIAGNDGVGELWRCKRCRGKHPYLSLNCVERPFHGLDQVLYVMWQQAGDLASVRSLSPSEAARRDAGTAIARQVVDTIPDLATTHPEMARRVAQQAGLSKFDVAVGGISLGVAEQIPVTLAQRLLDRINTNRPSRGKLSVGNLEVH